MCVKLQEYMVGFKYRHIVWRYKAAKNRLQLIIWPHKIAHLGRDYHLDWLVLPKALGMAGPGNFPLCEQHGWTQWTTSHRLETHPGFERSGAPVPKLFFDRSNVWFEIWCIKCCCDNLWHGFAYGFVWKWAIAYSNIFQWTILIFPIKKNTFLGIPYF